MCVCVCVCVCVNVCVCVCACMGVIDTDDLKIFLLLTVHICLEKGVFTYHSLPLLTSAEVVTL